MEQFIANLPGWVRGVGIIVVTVGVALAAHRLAMMAMGRAARRTTTQTDDLLLKRLRRPSRWLLVAFALTAIQPTLDLNAQGHAAWRQVAGILVPALIGWLAVAILRAGNDIVEVKADMTVEDNLNARRRRTRAAILHRIAVFLVLAVTACLILMSIPSIRSIGVTLIASAGLAALAVGAAAQPALKNLIAGLQMAFTEPIRIDDVVIMDGEWGRIEEIRLTYVVIKIWDERRLVVPVSKFLEESFQNWTRQTSQLLGSVFWYLDPAADIPRLRVKLGEIVSANKRWDGRFFNLQVTDMKNDAIEVRALMTAKDAAIAFDLRCDVREALLDYIRAEMPEAILRRRGEIVNERSGMAATMP
ncbi:mechanosensitive ion channel family protein [Sphingomonas nostoxanthinifaciens]|uniref:mechanosensitive ion channel family protein n=1 Tax=Sphingomonas nostoxanthinifaciens TaxID=2872652 RepID=UPI001CC1DE2E|nr:mechanosensitive ion channel domain-containing protein [Sphingomonas nostoxanthinifaciens]UAK23945.1 mechanosensitive ion channel family protein [Sphingomonas nostoxanthinifaciens]